MENFIVEYVARIFLPEMFHEKNPIELAPFELKISKQIWKIKTQDEQ